MLDVSADDLAAVALPGDGLPHAVGGVCRHMIYSRQACMKTPLIASSTRRPTK